MYGYYEKDLCLQSGGIIIRVFWKASQKSHVVILPHVTFYEAVTNNRASSRSVRHQTLSSCLAERPSGQKVTNGNWSGDHRVVNMNSCHLKLQTCTVDLRNLTKAFILPNHLLTNLPYFSLQFSNLVKSLDISYNNSSLVDVVIRSITGGLTLWLTLTVSEGMLHTHPPKWSPHVGNVKYSPALISLAPAVFHFTKLPSPDSSCPGVCGRVWWGRRLSPPPPSLPSSFPSPYDLTRPPPKIKCSLAPLLLTGRSTVPNNLSTLSLHHSTLHFIFIHSHHRDVFTFLRCLALDMRHTCLDNDEQNDGDDDKEWEDVTVRLIINGSFIPTS